MRSFDRVRLPLTSLRMTKDGLLSPSEASEGKARNAWNLRFRAQERPRHRDHCKLISGTQVSVQRADANPGHHRPKKSVLTRSVLNKNSHPSRRRLRSTWGPSAAFCWRFTSLKMTGVGSAFEDRSGPARRDFRDVESVHRIFRATQESADRSIGTSGYCSLSHSACAWLRMGMSESAFFQAAKKSWYAVRAWAVSFCRT